MATFPHGYALLVGVGKHQDDRYSLPTTVNDVQALEKLLRDVERCAYPAQNIKVLHDDTATKHAILDGLEWLGQCAQRDPRATIIFYYSGHGQRHEASEEYYLIPHDGVDLASRLAAHDLRAAVDAIKPERLLVLLDCCHAEGMGVKGLDDDEFSKAAPSERILGDLKHGAGRVVCSSSRAKESSYLRRDRDLSIFTYHLLEALQGADNKDNDTQVTVANLMHHLGKTVSASAQDEWEKPQTPVFKIDAEDFPVALIRAGNGFAKGGWQADQAEAHAVIDRIAPPTTSITNTFQGDVKINNSNALIGSHVEGDVNQSVQTDGINMQGATVGNGARFAGGNYYEGSAHVTGGTMHGSVIGTNMGTITHGGSSAATPAYTITIECADPLLRGRDNDVTISVAGLQAHKRYQVELRASNITPLKEDVFNGQAVFSVNPPYAGGLNITVTLYAHNDTMPQARVIHKVTVKDA